MTRDNSDDIALAVRVDGANTTFEFGRITAHELGQLLKRGASTCSRPQPSTIRKGHAVANTILDATDREVIADGGEDELAPRDPILEALAESDAAPDVPDRLLNGTRIGECYDCGARFEYGREDLAQAVSDHCPNCESADWTQWGFRTTDGVHVPRGGVDAVHYVEELAAGGEDP